MENLNQQKELDRIYQYISDGIREAEIRPSVVFHYAPKPYLPSNDFEWEMIAEEDDSVEENFMGRFFKWSNPSYL